MLAVDDLPASAFNADTLRAGMRTWRFWPTPAEVRAVIEEWRKAQWQAKADRPEPRAMLAAPKREVSAAEREYVAAQAALVRQELAASEERREAAFRAMRPHTVTSGGPVMSRATLNAIYAAKGLMGPPVDPEGIV